MSLSRRALLKVAAAAVGVAAVPSWLWQRSRSAVRRLAGVVPINRSVPGAGTTVFSGDNPDSVHQLLWDVPAYLRAHGVSPLEHATPDERIPLVIVGGGMSGLATAWLLRDREPLLLERADRFGGNARGESWQGVDYAIGAAYLLEADAGSPLEQMYREWGIADLCRIKTEDDPVLVEGTIHHDFWSGESDPEAAEQFTRVRDHFLAIWNEEGDAFYPEIPAEDPELLARVAQLDRVDFRSHLEAAMGGPLHPHVVAVLDHYCWSSLGARWDEVSAAAGLNFFAAEFGNVMVAPGGNAAVAGRVVELLHRELPGDRMRTGMTVFSVVVRDDGVMVGYADADGVPHTVLAQAVALCCPKFVVKRILQDIEPERSAAIARLRYRSYLLANVLLDTEPRDSFYDLFLADADPSRATDVVTATWARPVPGRSVLTLYRGLPYDGARPALLTADAHRRIEAEFEVQIRNEILPALGIDAAHLIGLRLTRWGHPLPLAAPGLLADGVPQVLRRPHRDRVFFIEQDNWALPAIETSLGEAAHFAPMIRAALG
ncbi:MAG TPA: FAD-dependent oxidoreductase [Gemmatimonadales bacterium]|nr:FAD-dependent oxidoreductase [Gemmatimonadales bacterium]